MAHVGSDKGISQRRACALLKIARSTWSYQPKRPGKDATVIARMKQLSKQYPRFGYRRIRVFLARDGFPMSNDRCHRLWQAAGLQVPAKRPRRRAGPRDPRPFCPVGPNVTWAIDFVHDACANGQVLKCLTVVDEYTRGCLAIDVSGRFRSAHVVQTLNRLVTAHGQPLHIKSDNGPEFISTALLTWMTEQGISPAPIQPGKPWQNGNNESFNGKFRDECLSAEWFRSRKEARAIIEEWRQSYNSIRPHSSIHYMTPNEYRDTVNQPHHRRPSFQ